MDVVFDQRINSFKGLIKLTLFHVLGIVVHMRFAIVKPWEVLHLGAGWFRIHLATFNHWIGLRENLQETMVFTTKYRAFLQIFPSSNSMIQWSWNIWNSAPEKCNKLVRKWSEVQARGCVTEHLVRRASVSQVQNRIWKTTWCYLAKANPWTAKSAKGVFQHWNQAMNLVVQQPCSNLPVTISHCDMFLVQ